MYKPSIRSRRRIRSICREVPKGSRALKVGDGFGDGTRGQLIDENAVSKVQEHIEDAVQKGGELLYGGQQIAELDGHFIQPTVWVGK